MHTLWLGISLLMIVVGLVGTIMPIMPGLFLILAGQLVYASATGFQLVGTGFLLWMLLLAVLGSLADIIASQVAARRKGASPLGLTGALVGGLAGTIWLGPVGMVLGPLAGAVLGELAQGSPLERASAVGWRVFLGVWLGTLSKLVIGLAMAALFLIRIF